MGEDRHDEPPSAAPFGKNAIRDAHGIAANHVLGATRLFQIPRAQKQLEAKPVAVFVETRHDRERVTSLWNGTESVPKPGRQPLEWLCRNRRLPVGNDALAARIARRQTQSESEQERSCRHETR